MAPAYLAEGLNRVPDVGRSIVGGGAFPMVKAHASGTSVERHVSVIAACV
jgi:hypothetical protein